MNMASINPNDYFSPGRALTGASDLFVGRELQLADALRFLDRGGSSLTVLGQCGIGKTSFEWQLKEILQAGSTKGRPHRASEILWPHALKACETLWIQCRKDMRDVTGVLLALLQPPAVGGDKTLPSIKHDPLLTPQEVTEVIRKIELNLGFAKIGTVVKKSPKQKPSTAGEQRAIELSPDESKAWQLFYQAIRRLTDQIEREVIVFVDAFDSLPQRGGMGRLINECNDARFVVVGIAESSKEILEDHGSVHRRLRDLEIPPLSEAEVYAVFTNAEAISAERCPECALRFDSEYTKLILDATGGYPDLVHEYGYAALEYARDRSSGPGLILDQTLFSEVASRIYTQKTNKPDVQRIREAVQHEPGREAVLCALCRFPHGWVDEEALRYELPIAERRKFGPDIEALETAGMIEKDAPGEHARFKIPRDRQIILNLVRNNIRLT